VGIYGHNEPFVIRTPDGKIVGGLDVELVSGLARHLGVRAEFDLTCVHYADLFRKLHKGEIDVAVGGLSHTFARAQYVHFSGTYVRLNQSLIMRRSELARRHIEENPFAYLETATNAVGVLAGSSFYEYARHHFSNAIVRECSDWQEALQALGRDEVLAVLDDNNTVALLARKHPEIALDVTVYILKNMRDNIAVAISPVNPHLESCINLYLELHDLDLDLNDLMQRYPAVYRCE